MIRESIARHLRPGRGATVRPAADDARGRRELARQPSAPAARQRRRGRRVRHRAVGALQSLWLLPVARTLDAQRLRHG